MRPSDQNHIVISWSDLLLIIPLQRLKVSWRNQERTAPSAVHQHSRLIRGGVLGKCLFIHQSRIDYKILCFSASNLFSKSRSPNLFLLRNNPQFTLARMHQFCSFEVWRSLMDICLDIKIFIRRISTAAATWSTPPGSAWTTPTPAVP